MKEDIEDLINSVDIVDYCSHFTDLELRGREYWGLSPLKEEKTASFSIDPEKQAFCDFSSGKSGGIIQFIEAYYQCSTYHAVLKLKEYIKNNGITVQSGNKLSIMKVCRKYNRKKTDELLTEAKVLPENIISKYEWSEEKLRPWYEEEISYEVMKKFGVRYDPFTNRIVYPIRNLKGDIINVGARTLDPNYKAKGLRKYSYIQGWGGGMQTIYGLHENLEKIIEKKFIILFEGAKSVLKCASHGIANTGALLTSHLNTHQMHILLSVCVPNDVAVIFALDNDVNIADDKNIRKLLSYVKVYYIKDKHGWLDEKDSPVDKGFDVFKQLCREKVRLR